MTIPPCVEYAPDYGDLPVPPEMRREGVTRVIAWTCLDPRCPVPRDDDGPANRPGMHFVVFR